MHHFKATAHTLGVVRSFFDRVRRLSTAVNLTTPTTATMATTNASSIPTIPTVRTTEVVSKPSFDFAYSGGRWPTSTLFTPVESAFSKRLGEFRDHTRLQNSFSHVSSSFNSLPSVQSQLVGRSISVARHINLRAFNQTSDRIGGQLTRLPQLYQSDVCNPKKDRWTSTSFQLARFEQLRRLSSLQNGDSSTGLIDDRTRRLHDINRYVGCLPSPSGSSGLSALPPVPLEGSDVSIQDDSIRSLDSPLLVHQDHSSNLGMGSPTRDSSQCLPRRLDHSRQDERRSIDEHQQDSSVPYTPGLDCQLEKISTNTKDDLGTPRLRIGFSDDVSSTSGKETSRPASINSTTDQQTSPDAESDSECDHENTSSNNGDLSSSTLHTTPVTPEEQPDPPPSRLGSPTPTDERQHCGTEMVVEQSTTVERPVDSSIDSSSHTVRGCQQHGLGMRVPEPSGTRLLDSSGSPDVDQLARTESGLSGTPDIPEPAEHDGPHPHRQYDFNGIHKQTRRYEVLQSDDISDNAVEMVSTPRPNAHSKSRVGFRQHRSGLRVQKIFHKKPLASQTPGLQEPPSVAMGSSRGRSVCGPNKQPPRKVRIVEERSGGMEDRRLLSELEQASEPVCQSSLELDPSLPGEDPPRTSPANHSGGSLLANSSLVSSAAESSPGEPSVPSSSGHPVHHTFDTMASSTSVEALRLETLGSTFAAPELTETSASLLRSRRLSDNSTNRSYKRGQSLFIEWALSQDIPLKTFNEVHLTNFLSEMFETRGYQHGTIRLFRSAVTHLNSNPSVLRSSEMVNTLVQSLAARAPPKPIHRPTVDLGPSLAAMKKIDTNSPSTLLSHIQQKLAFLLGMAAFLRPSDLHRIDFSSAVVESDSGRRFLSFTVVAPKEKRKGQRIIKPFRVFEHHDSALCPVATFVCLRDRLSSLSPAPTVSSFFVNCGNTSQMVTVSNISTWLRRIIRLSTDETRVNVRSLASSLALRSGVPLDDIVTLGNWASSSVFEQHYRREHLSLVDFTNTVLPSPVVDPPDVFHDALSEIS